MNAKIITKIVFAVIAICYFINCALSPDSYHLIGTVDLLMHEAGHWIFWLLGEFMHVLGGSLNQILIPFLFVVYFWTQKDKFSAGICLLWVSENFIGVARYAGDAVVMQLELLGGGNGWESNSIHDWNWLLIKTGLLHNTNQISGAINAVGWLVLISAIILISYSIINDINSSTTNEKV